MRQRIVIEYDPINQVVSVVENDFRNIELFGILEYVKEMAVQDEFREENQ